MPVSKTIFEIEEKAQSERGSSEAGTRKLQGKDGRSQRSTRLLQGEKLLEVAELRRNNSLKQFNIR